MVDGADNFPVRYMLNDASVKLGIPVVHGSIFRFEGQVTVFDPRKADPPTATCCPNLRHRNWRRVAPRPGCWACCPGLVGTIQAIETVKLILGFGDSLVGRYLTVDTQDMEFREFKLRRDPNNEITWENRDRIQVVPLEGHCMPAPLAVPA